MGEDLIWWVVAARLFMKKFLICTLFLIRASHLIIFVKV